MAQERVTDTAAIGAIAAWLDREAASWFDRAAATGRPEDRPACRRGCAFCCYQLVPLTLLEANRIADYLRKLSRDQRRQLVAAIERQSQRFAAWVQTYRPSDVRDRATNLNYLRQRIPCPFLGPENDCRIYPVRPLICRGHHALQSNLACQSGESAIRTIPGLDQATTEAMKQARDLAAALGLTPTGGLISTFAPLFKSALTKESFRSGVSPPRP